MKIKKIVVLIIITSVFLLFGGLSVTIANSSISGTLSSWLDNKTETSIKEIDLVIQEEQEKQTKRLKEVVTEEIAEVETEWEAFLRAQKEKQRNQLRDYADEQMKKIGEAHPQRIEKAEQEFEQIILEAMEEIHRIAEEASENEGGFVK